MSEIGFDVRSGEVQVRAVFFEPAFHLFQDTPGLLRQVYGALQPLGVALGDVKLDASGSLADAHLSVSLIRLSAVLRLRLDHFELNCFEVRNAQSAELADVFVKTAAVLKEHLSGSRVASYSVTAGFHGLLEGEAVGAFIERFVMVRGLELGAPAGAGGVMYFGPSGPRSAASVTLDPSALIQAGLFLRLNGIWDAASIDASALRTVGLEFMDQAMGQLGIKRR